MGAGWVGGGVWAGGIWFSGIDFPFFDLPANYADLLRRARMKFTAKSLCALAALR
jgi:hypothetical protein